MSDDIPAETRVAVCEAIYAGRKIEAIKIYRNASNVGLKDAKDFVEALEARLRAESPEKFSAKSTTGCSAVVAVIAIATTAAALAWMAQ